MWIATYYTFDSFRRGELDLNLRKLPQQFWYNHKLETMLLAAVARLVGHEPPVRSVSADGGRYKKMPRMVQEMADATGYHSVDAKRMRERETVVRDALPSVRRELREGAITSTAILEATWGGAGEGLPSASQSGASCGMHAKSAERCRTVACVAAHHEMRKQIGHALASAFRDDRPDAVVALKVSWDEAALRLYCGNDVARRLFPELYLGMPEMDKMIADAQQTTEATNMTTDHQTSKINI